ncbi:hypothetical protein SAMN02910298_01098 [Pseudobutyrivibrio sp. YE44]|uniref:hypothetical protein n=1 Tax=Pseudobutyrivibrio sp. YE44 TaxID=1520802 RepID=UPI00088683AD|nr:hypothetical protein [Pseudobutyrivibrio sp. YE44]SDB22672.1 hypothetical protein SAMN02910298_01098 [Pseudobutyrivibrio sp. YE44]
MKNAKRIALLAMVGALACTTVGCKAITVSSLDEKLEDTILESLWDLIKDMLDLDVELEEAQEYLETLEEEVPEENGQLSAEELKEFQDHFNQEEFNGLLATDYHKPEDMEWELVVYSGGIGYKVEDGASEYDAYCQFSGYDFGKPIIIVPKNDLEEFAKVNTGVDYSAATKPLKEAFLEDFDAYAFYHVDSLYRTYEFTEGTKDGDTYTLTYKSTGEAEGEDEERILPKQVVVKKVDDNYQVVSNLTLWETDANPAHTGEISIPQCTGTCKLVQYNPAEGNANKGIEFRVIEDDLLVAKLPDYTYADKDERLWTEVDDIQLFDFTGDNKADAVITGKKDGKPYVGLYKYDNDGFSKMTDLANKTSANAKAKNDYSIDCAKEFLLGDNKECKFADYKEAYAHIAHLAELTEDDYKFELALINDDDEPELVQLSPNNLLNIFTFKDGHVETLLCDYYLFDSCIIKEFVEKANFVLFTNYHERNGGYENEYVILEGDEEYEIYYKEWNEETADNPSYASSYKDDVSREDDHVASQEKISELDQQIFQDFQLNLSPSDVYSALK